jgi:hypothetical protein
VEWKKKRIERKRNREEVSKEGKQATDKKSKEEKKK